MADLQIRQFSCFADNYGVLIHDPATGATATIDAPEAGPIQAVLDETGWKLTDILITHHHQDHVEGVAALKARYGARVVGPAAEAAKIANLDLTVGEGADLSFAGYKVEVIETPGHTLGHIAYVIPAAKLAFVGDTLFALGCGRVIEGTMDQMWASLLKLRALSPDTAVYCGHEYTLANAKFAVTVDPANKALARRVAEIEMLRAGGKPTLPTSIAREIETNPFLRADVDSVKAAIGMAGAPAAAVFAELRTRKNRF